MNIAAVILTTLGLGIFSGFIFSYMKKYSR